MSWQYKKPEIHYDRFKCRRCGYIWREPIYNKAKTPGTINTLCKPCIRQEEEEYEQGQQEQG
jgi:hypothetical protein